jgi:hypothetical protein
MTDITIPPKALEAAAKALYNRHVEINKFASLCPDWEELDNMDRSYRQGYRGEAYAACLAMLKAWPGMRHGHNETGTNEDWAQWFGLPWHRAEASDGLILPLTTENTND